ncbi:MAG TPA: hypothetical protein VK421_07330 [Pyrinomonadaceae bacterium]|nr:hypothetical protein [Pyrinomonadaceae bacterium]
MSDAGRLFTRAAGFCSVLAPLPLLAGDVMQIAGGLGFGWTIALWASFVLFVPAVFGATYLAVSRGSRLALVGGASAYFGAMAGASMQVLFRSQAVLTEAGSPHSVELLRGSLKLVASTQMIGIFFPAGLIILAISLYRSRAVGGAVAVALAAGAVLFPLGRVAGLLVGFIGGDLLLITAFGVIGLRLLAEGAEAVAPPAHVRS